MGDIYFTDEAYAQLEKAAWCRVMVTAKALWLGSAEVTESETILRLNADHDDAVTFYRFVMGVDPIIDWASLGGAA